MSASKASQVRWYHAFCVSDGWLCRVSDVAHITNPPPLGKSAIPWFHLGFDGRCGGIVTLGLRVKSPRYVGIMLSLFLTVACLGCLI